MNKELNEFERVYKLTSKDNPEDILYCKLIKIIDERLDSSDSLCYINLLDIDSNKKNYKIIPIDTDKYKISDLNINIKDLEDILNSLDENSVNPISNIIVHSTYGKNQKINIGNIASIKSNKLEVLNVQEEYYNNSHNLSFIDNKIRIKTDQLNRYNNLYHRSLSELDQLNDIKRSIINKEEFTYIYARFVNDPDNKEYCWILPEYMDPSSINVGDKIRLLDTNNHYQPGLVTKIESTKDYLGHKVLCSQV